MDGRRSGVISRVRLVALTVAVVVVLGVAGLLAARRGSGGHGHAAISRAELLKLQARVTAAAPQLRADGIQLVSWSAGVGTDDRENITVRDPTVAQQQTLARLFGARDIRLIAVNAVGGTRTVAVSDGG